MLEFQWLQNPSVQKLIQALRVRGVEPYFVGGCVRNSLLNIPISDIDIATATLPLDVDKYCRDAGFKTIPTGLDHGTITVLVDDQPFEITTFRKDVATDGRRATVAFSTDMIEDARRRDFTMNALYVDADGALFDPLNGLGDITSRRIRFIGTAMNRIREDYLRILRYFRFHAYYADPEQGFDSVSLDACHRGIEGISTLSKERIGHEMRKLLAAPDPSPALATMQTIGLLPAILTGGTAKFIAPLVHLEAGHPAHWLARLFVLGGEDIQKSLCLSKAENRMLDQLRTATAIGYAPPRAGYILGRSLARAYYLALSAMTETPPAPDYMAAIELGAAHQRRFPVRAADLGRDLRGPEIGARLAELEERWIYSDFSLSKEALLT
ncbi:poly(A) polymerase [Amylibacter marinus]|uniref:Poly(A) polymerase n=1 Tax=Amylibacter marinus TaxID=1475483 RepID=A0ABQ5VVC2_9RHOB|nr:CCA tRNA nucleotidyltransferase [Amylibacter marinus]GLQ35382.1 poly(A) polymerase [Amylibacter marinus]